MLLGPNSCFTQTRASQNHNSIVCGFPPRPTLREARIRDATPPCLGSFSLCWDVCQIRQKWSLRSRSYYCCHYRDFFPIMIVTYDCYYCIPTSFLGSVMVPPNQDPQGMNGDLGGCLFSETRMPHNGPAGILWQGTPKT